MGKLTYRGYKNIFSKLIKDEDWVERLAIENDEIFMQGYLPKPQSEQKYWKARHQLPAFLFVSNKGKFIKVKPDETLELLTPSILKDKKGELTYREQYSINGQKYMSYDIVAVVFGADATTSKVDELISKHGLKAFKQKNMKEKESILVAVEGHHRKGFKEEPGNEARAWNNNPEELELVIRRVHQNAFTNQPDLEDEEKVGKYMSYFMGNKDFTEPIIIYDKTSGSQKSEKLTEDFMKRVKLIKRAKIRIDNVEIDWNDGSDEKDWEEFKQNAICWINKNRRAMLNHDFLYEIQYGNEVRQYQYISKAKDKIMILSEEYYTKIQLKFIFQDIGNDKKQISMRVQTVD